MLRRGAQRLIRQQRGTVSHMQLSREKSTEADKPQESQGMNMSQMEAMRQGLQGLLKELDKDKAGSPSPWTQFDAWGAGSGEVHESPDDLSLLSPESLRIPDEEGGEKEAKNVSNTLSAYDRLLKARSSVHFGYPYNLVYNHEELYHFMKYSINNLGDPFIPSNYGVHSRQFELAVIEFFAKLWKIEAPDYWGYVTTCGTEGNLHGILLSREVLPGGVLYTSVESHYSLFKAARYYCMDSCAIKASPSGEMNYQHLEAEIKKNIDRPVIINCNIGTTVKGAVDSLDRILEVLHRLNIPRERFYIHCDGALFAMMLPFVSDYNGTELSFEKPIDSIAVSGHKMLGSPMPCGIAITRMKHVKKVEQRIDYLNSVDTTIMGSRNGQAPLFMWYSLKRKGMEGIKKDVEHCLRTAEYLRDTLTKAGIVCRLNFPSTTVVMERPKDQDFVLRWQLACEDDIAHVVVMPNITDAKIDIFVEEFKAQRDTLGAFEDRPGSPLHKLKNHTWS